MLKIFYSLNNYTIRTSTDWKKEFNVISAKINLGEHFFKKDGELYVLYNLAKAIKDESFEHENFDSLKNIIAGFLRIYLKKINI